jgi:hypothetical protein
MEKASPVSFRQGHAAAGTRADLPQAPFAGGSGFAARRRLSAPPRRAVRRGVRAARAQRKAPSRGQGACPLSRIGSVCARRPAPDCSRGAIAMALPQGRVFPQGVSRRSGGVSAPRSRRLCVSRRFHAGLGRAPAHALLRAAASRPMPRRASAARVQDAAYVRGLSGSGSGSFSAAALRGQGSGRCFRGGPPRAGFVLTFPRRAHAEGVQADFPMKGLCGTAGG